MKLPALRLFVIASLLCLWLLSVIAIANCTTPECDQVCVLSKRWCNCDNGCFDFARKKGVYYSDGCTSSGQGSGTSSSTVSYDWWSDCTPQCTADCSPTSECVGAHVGTGSKAVFTVCST